MLKVRRPRVRLVTTRRDFQRAPSRHAAACRAAKSLFGAALIFLAVPQLFAFDLFRTSLERQPWELVVSLPGYVLTIDGMISKEERLSVATHQTTGANLTLLLDRHAESATMERCRAERMARCRPQETIRKTDVRFFERGAWLLVEYVAQLEGSRIREWNVFACTVKDGVAVDLHFAKAFYRPEDANLFPPILDSVRFEARDPAILHYERGNGLYEAQDFAGAAVAYREAVRLNPDSPEAHAGLGKALARSGEMMEAMAAFRRALTLRPTLAQARLGLAALYEQQGDLDSALREYQNAARADPDLAEARYNLGRLLHEKGDLDAAIAEHQAALSLRPDLPDAWFSFGVALQERGDLDAAITAYRRAVEGFADGPDADESKLAAAHLKLGVAVFLKGRDAEAALAEVREAVRLEPGSAPARLVLAGLLMARGDREAALEECQAATRLAPDDPDVRARCRELAQSGPSKISQD